MKQTKHVITYLNSQYRSVLKHALLTGAATISAATGLYGMSGVINTADAATGTVTTEDDGSKTWTIETGGSVDLDGTAYKDAASGAGVNKIDKLVVSKNNTVVNIKSGSYTNGAEGYPFDKGYEITNGGKVVVEKDGKLWSQTGRLDVNKYGKLDVNGSVQAQDISVDRGVVNLSGSSTDNGYGGYARIEGVSPHSFNMPDWQNPDYSQGTFDIKNSSTVNLNGNSMLVGHKQMSVSDNSTVTLNGNKPSGQNAGLGAGGAFIVVNEQVKGQGGNLDITDSTIRAGTNKGGTIAANHVNFNNSSLDVSYGSDLLLERGIKKEAAQGNPWVNGKYSDKAISGNRDGFDDKGEYNFKQSNVSIAGSANLYVGGKVEDPSQPKAGSGGLTVTFDDGSRVNVSNSGKLVINASAQNDSNVVEFKNGSTLTNYGQVDIGQGSMLKLQAGSSSKKTTDAFGREQANYTDFGTINNSGTIAFTDGHIVVDGLDALNVGKGDPVKTGKVQLENGAVLDSSKALSDLDANAFKGANAYILNGNSADHDGADPTLYSTDTTYTTQADHSTNKDTTNGILVGGDNLTFKAGDGATPGSATVGGQSVNTVDLEGETPVDTPDGALSSLDLAKMAGDALADASFGAEKSLKISSTDPSVTALQIKNAKLKLGNVGVKEVDGEVGTVEPDLIAGSGSLIHVSGRDWNAQNVALNGNAAMSVDGVKFQQAPDARADKTLDIGQAANDAASLYINNGGEVDYGNVNLNGDSNLYLDNGSKIHANNFVRGSGGTSNIHIDNNSNANLDNVTLNGNTNIVMGNGSTLSGSSLTTGNDANALDITIMGGGNVNYNSIDIGGNDSKVYLGNAHVSGGKVNFRGDNTTVTLRNESSISGGDITFANKGTTSVKNSTVSGDSITFSDGSKLNLMNGALIHGNSVDFTNTAQNQISGSTISGTNISFTNSDTKAESGSKISATGQATVNGSDLSLDNSILEAANALINNGGKVTLKNSQFNSTGTINVSGGDLDASNGSSISGSNINLAGNNVNVDGSKLNSNSLTITAGNNTFANGSNVTTNSATVGGDNTTVNVNNSQFNANQNFTINGGNTNFTNNAQVNAGSLNITKDGTNDTHVVADNSQLNVNGVVNIGNGSDLSLKNNASLSGGNIIASGNINADRSNIYGGDISLVGGKHQFTDSNINSAKGFKTDGSDVTLDSSKLDAVNDILLSGGKFTASNGSSIKSSNGQINLDSLDSILNGSSITANNEVTVNSGSLNMSNGSSISGSSVNLNGTTGTLDRSDILANNNINISGGAINATSSNIHANSNLNINSGKHTASGNSSLSGSNVNLTDAELALDGSKLNGNDIKLQGGKLSGTNGSSVNAANDIVLNGDSSLDASNMIAGGNINLNGGTHSYTNGSKVQGNSVSGTGANVTLDRADLSGSLINLSGGQITAQNGSNINASAGDLNLNGTNTTINGSNVNASGDVLINGGTHNLAGNAVVSGANVVLTGANMNSDSSHIKGNNVTLGNGTTYSGSNSSIEAINGDVSLDDIAKGSFDRTDIIASNNVNIKNGSHTFKNASSIKGKNVNVNSSDLALDGSSISGTTVGFTGGKLTGSNNSNISGETVSFNGTEIDLTNTNVSGNDITLENMLTNNSINSSNINATNDLNLNSVIANYDGSNITAGNELNILAGQHTLTNNSNLKGKTVTISGSNVSLNQSNISGDTITVKGSDLAGTNANINAGNGDITFDTVNGTFNGSNVIANGNVNITKGKHTFQNGSKLQGKQVNLNSSDVTLDGSQLDALSGLLVSGGKLNANNGSTINVQSGDFTLDSGDLSGSGSSINIASGNFVSNNGNVNLDSSNLTASGDVTFNGGNHNFANNSNVNGNNINFSGSNASISNSHLTAQGNVNVQNGSNVTLDSGSSITGNKLDITGTGSSMTAKGESSLTFNQVNVADNNKLDMTNSSLDIKGDGSDQSVDLTGGKNINLVAGSLNLNKGSDTVGLKYDSSTGKFTLGDGYTQVNVDAGTRIELAIKDLVSSGRISIADANALRNQLVSGNGILNLTDAEIAINVNPNSENDFHDLVGQINGQAGHELDMMLEDANTRTATITGMDNEDKISGGWKALQTNSGVNNINVLDERTLALYGSKDNKIVSDATGAVGGVKLGKNSAINISNTDHADADNLIGDIGEASGAENTGTANFLAGNIKVVKVGDESSLGDINVNRFTANGNGGANSTRVTAGNLEANNIAVRGAHLVIDNITNGSGDFGAYNANIETKKLDLSKAQNALIANGSTVVVKDSEENNLAELLAGNLDITNEGTSVTAGMFNANNLNVADKAKVDVGNNLTIADVLAISGSAQVKGKKVSAKTANVSNASLEGTESLDIAGDLVADGGKVSGGTINVLSGDTTLQNYSNLSGTTVNLKNLTATLSNVSGDTLNVSGTFSATNSNISGGDITAQGAFAANGGTITANNLNLNGDSTGARDVVSGYGSSFDGTKVTAKGIKGKNLAVLNKSNVDGGDVDLAKLLVSGGSTFNATSITTSDDFAVDGSTITSSGAINANSFNAKNNSSVTANNIHTTAGFDVNGSTVKATGGDIVVGSAFNADSSTVNASGAITVGTAFTAANNSNISAGGNISANGAFSAQNSTVNATGAINSNDTFLASGSTIGAGGDINTSGSFSAQNSTINATGAINANDTFLASGSTITADNGINLKGTTAQQQINGNDYNAVFDASNITAKGSGIKGKSLAVLNGSNVTSSNLEVDDRLLVTGNSNVSVDKLLLSGSDTVAYIGDYESKSTAGPNNGNLVINNNDGLQLNGGTLIIDPDDASPRSTVFVKASASQPLTMTGNIVVGQNAAFGYGSNIDDFKTSYRDPDKTASSYTYVDGQIDTNGHKLIMGGEPIADLENYLKPDNNTSVYMGKDALIDVTSNAFTTSSNSSPIFKVNSDKGVVGNGATIWMPLGFKGTPEEVAQIFGDQIKAEIAAGGEVTITNGISSGKITSEDQLNGKAPIEFVPNDGSGGGGSGGGDGGTGGGDGGTGGGDGGTGGGDGGTGGGDGGTGGGDGGTGGGDGGTGGGDGGTGGGDGGTGGGDGGDGGTGGGDGGTGGGDGDHGSGGHGSHAGHGYHDPLQFAVDAAQSSKKYASFDEYQNAVKNATDTNPAYDDNGIAVVTSEAGYQFINDTGGRDLGASVDRAAQMASYGGAVQSVNLAMQAANEVVATRNGGHGPSKSNAVTIASSNTDLTPAFVGNYREQGMYAPPKLGKHAAGADYGTGKTANNAGHGTSGHGGGTTMWVAPSYKSAEISDVSLGQSINGQNAFGNDINLYGITAGVDVTTDSHVVAGAFINAGGGTSDGRGAAQGVSNDFTFFGVGAYAGYNPNDNLNFNADLSYTTSSNDIKSNVGILGWDELSAKTDASVLSLGIGAQYSVVTEVGNIKPHINLRYSRFSVDDHDVTSNGKTIARSKLKDFNTFSIPIGVTYSNNFDLGNGWSLTPEVDATVTFNKGTLDLESSTEFTGVYGTSLERHAEVLEKMTYGAKVGLVVNGPSVGFGVDVGYVGSKNSNELGVNANVKAKF